MYILMSRDEKVRKRRLIGSELMGLCQADHKNRLITLFVITLSSFHCSLQKKTNQEVSKIALVYFFNDLQISVLQLKM